MQRDLEGQLVDCQALHCKALECQRADQRVEREKWLTEKREMQARFEDEIALVQAALQSRPVIEETPAPKLEALPLELVPSGGFQHLDKILDPPGDLLALRGHLLLDKLHEATSDVYLQSLACAEAVEEQRQVANEMAELELQIQALQGGPPAKSGGSSSRRRRSSQGT